MNYFDKYGTIFFSANPHVELAGSSQHIKDLGFYKQSRDLVTTIIEDMTVLISHLSFP
jgi:hypothetical protein